LGELTYDYMMNRLNEPVPKGFNGVNNTYYNYYFNKLMTMVYSMYDFGNLPEGWNKPYLLEHLFQDGMVAVTDTDLGVLALQCGHFGVNVYNQPTNVNIANVVLGSFERTIGLDCEVIYFSYVNGRYQSIIPLVSRYAVLLAQIDASLNTTLMNSRVAHVFRCTTQAQIKSAQRLYEDISKGYPAVFMRKSGDDMEETQFANVKNTFIGQELLQVKKTIMNEFLSEIGINNANVEKRERMITSEADSNAGELYSMVSVWLDTIKQCIEKVNAHYELNITVDYNPFVIGKVTEEVLPDAV